ncbi:MAG: transposase, partial [Proteobacteria bacterium]|nr:transposase [Pseudomonadota bacterium]
MMDIEFCRTLAQGGQSSKCDTCDHLEETLSRKEFFAGPLSTVMEKEWVVYSKKPFKSPRRVFDYLGRYTHRTAISNNRLISMDGGRVRFGYRDRRQDYAPRV